MSRQPRLAFFRLSFLFLAFACLTLWTTGASADDKDKPEAKITLPMVFSKTVPENAGDLKEIQKHVQELVKKLRPAVVGLQVGAASGSGVIINKEGHVLTAGHVSGVVGRDVRIILADGRKLKGKSLGRNTTIDSGLVQITDKAEFPYLDMGISAELKKGDWCLAIGHPGGVKPGRAPVVRLGRVLDNAKTVIRTDAVLVGGDSGGPLFDMRGMVIGIHSRIGQSLTQNMHVPVDTYRETWDKLASSEEWGLRLFGGGGPKNPKGAKADPYMGIQFDFKDNTGKVTLIEPKSPGEKAGLKINDLITQFDGKAIADQIQLNGFLSKKQPNDEITLIVKRGEENLTIKLKLEKTRTK